MSQVLFYYAGLLTRQPWALHPVTSHVRTRRINVPNTFPSCLFTRRTRGSLRGSFTLCLLGVTGMQPNNKDVIVGHVLANPSSGTIVQQADGKFSDVMVTANNRGMQSQSNKSPLVARLDAKKTLAEISIPVVTEMDMKIRTWKKMTDKSFHIVQKGDACNFWKERSRCTASHLVLHHRHLL